MKKKHIVSIGYLNFAVDSITAANNLIGALGKAEQVDYDYESGTGYVYKPLKEEEESRAVSLKLNQKYKPAAPPKPEPKTLALPQPKRGTILCICEKSYVAPRQSCPHCGRGFAESHNRTHADQPKDTGPNLRLI